MSIIKGNIAALGTQEFTGVFAAAGVDPFVVAKDQDQIRKRAAEIVEGEYALVFVSEDVAELAEETFSSWEEKVTPVLLAVPFMSDSSGFALRRLGVAVKHATGVDIVQ